MPDTTPVQSNDSLYATDFVLWAETQAARIREIQSQIRSGGYIDVEHIAEELEGLAARDRRDLSSRINTVIVHLLKLQYSRAAEPRRGWMETIDRDRDEIARLIEDSPSLGRAAEVQARIDRETPRAERVAGRALAAFGESLDPLPGRRFAREQVLGDWFPAPPAEP